LPAQYTLVLSTATLAAPAEPVESVTTHSPAVQDVLHARPQPPQFALSVCKSAHAPGHRVSRHVHAPAAQSGLGCAHGTPVRHWPFAPQVSTLLPEHRAAPGAHTLASVAPSGPASPLGPDSWPVASASLSLPEESTATAESTGDDESGGEVASETAASGAPPLSRPSDCRTAPPQPTPAASTRSIAARLLFKRSGLADAGLTRCTIARTRQFNHMRKGL
jgi:hypothetical protein